MRTLGAIVALLRIAGVVAMTYRASFIGEIFMALGWAFWTVVPLFVLFEQAPLLSGWTWEEGLLVMGFFVMMEGILGAFVEPNLGSVVEHVRQGTFDFLMLKPIDTQLYVSVHRIAPTRLPHLVMGIAITTYAASFHPPSLGQLLVATGLMGAGVVLMHSLSTLVVCTSFWFVRVDNLSNLLKSVLDAGRWPIHFYRGPIRFVLTFVVPVGLMTSYPAMALRGTLGASSALLALGVSVAFAVLARIAWTSALRRYSSASS